MSIRVSRIPFCRHIKSDGRICKSPALASSAFCYHHRKLRRIRPSVVEPVPALTTQPLAPLNDRQSILRALNLVLNGLAMGQLDNRTAGQMIYLIQIAGYNLNQAPMDSMF
jgi:hypothetical protein